MSYHLPLNGYSLHMSNQVEVMPSSKVAAQGIIAHMSQYSQHNSIKYVSVNIPVLQTYFCCVYIALVPFKKVEK